VTEATGARYFAKPIGMFRVRTKEAYVFAFLEGNELLVVLLIVLVLFGGSKLPQLARSLGQAQREFARGRRDDEPAATATPAAPAASEAEVKTNGESITSS
jgi:sec-independent protein translocase protein TatA